MSFLTSTSTVELGRFCLLGAVIFFAASAVLAQEVRTSTDLEQRARDAAYAVDSLRLDAAAKQGSVKSAQLLEGAAARLTKLSEAVAAGATMAETRPEMTAAVRLLDHAYRAAKEAGEYPQSDLFRAVESLMRDLDGYYKSKSASPR